MKRDIQREREMNVQQKHGGGAACSPRVAMVVMGVCLAGYIVVPPLYWHLTEAIAYLRRSSCPPCTCDCSSLPLISLTEGLNNSIFTDCMKRDPEVSEEMEKRLRDMLIEEMKSKQTEALEKQQRIDKALLEAKKMTSQYQKEADKCNSGMETCEAAREKAEAELEAQKEVTAMWELRARQKGWKGLKPHHSFNGEMMEIDSM